MPRAPSSAARATDWTISSRPISSIGASRVGALEAVELGEDGAQREHHVVAGVAVGDGEDVEVVDLLAAGLEVRQRSGDGGAEANQVGVGHGARQRALRTLPAFKQRVHTYTRRGALPTMIRTF